MRCGKTCFGARSLGLHTLVNLGVPNDDPAHLADPSGQDIDAQPQPRSTTSQSSALPPKNFRHPAGPSKLSESGLLRSTASANVSPSKSRVHSATDLARAGSPVGSPSKRVPANRERKSSIWDSLFQVDVMYQKSRK
jgi:hypothetical protein